MVEISLKNSDDTFFNRNDSSPIKIDAILERNLHVQEDVHEQAQNHVRTSECAIISLHKDNMRPALNIHLEGECPTKIKGTLTKSATFPLSGKTLPSALDGGGEASDTAQHGQSSPRCENPSCNRSMSMPTSKLVSAMKGGREQQGYPWLVKLNVKWAPDVYDPPPTSKSHTVKSNHNQRPRANRRKDKKHKRRSKSAHGSGNDKKHQSNRSVGSSDHLQLRSEASGRSVPIDGFDQPTEVKSSTASGDSSVLLDGFDQQREIAVPSMKVMELSVDQQRDAAVSSPRHGIISWQEGLQVR